MDGARFSSIIFGWLLLGLSISTSAQKYFTKDGSVHFFSATIVEDIEAINNSVTCIVDIKTGELISKVKMKAFEFDKKLMQEHFNENYIESDKFPYAILKAKISNIQEIDFASELKQTIELIGNLTIHGATNEVKISGEIEKSGQSYLATSNFVVKTADYKIKIPKLVRNNIAKEIEVSLKFKMFELQ